ncbi:MAG: tRNA lysidine(34) synthetase TilS [Oscillospiraceae bacterium]|nr:tRNA lysidine(34) synthetase TilS [Oscillospiraceae bacterium]
MWNKLQAFIREYQLISPGDKVCCAVSGGADSIAMLFALYLLREKLDIDLSAAHFNHHLRGVESDRDEEFVRTFCDRYDIPLTVSGAAVVSGKKGLEAAARDARYGFLNTLPGKIATAHTADDNAETVLMHLVRGTGLKGLGGIAPQNGKLIRPMLSVTRQEVLAFNQEYNLVYVSDSSNKTDDFLRNRLRHHVMPLLRQENPCFGENTSQMALRLRQDEKVLSDLSVLEKPLVSRILELPQALQNRFYAAFLKQCGVKEPEAEHLKLLHKLVISNNPSAKANFPGNVTVSRNYDLLETQTEKPKFTPQEISCPGKAVWNDTQIICAPAEEFVNTPNCFTVQPQGKLVVRTRETGDSIRLRGGSKSLKKLFIDKKIPANLRDFIPVIADDAGVLAVAGIGADENRIARQLPAVTITLKQIKE